MTRYWYVPPSLWLAGSVGLVVYVMVEYWP
jgi:hypothetical protein